jgi:hypothetical protein
MRYLLLPLGLLLTPAAHAQTGGFTADELVQSARASVAEAAPNAPAMRHIAARSERLRAVLAVAMDQAVNRLSNEELRTLTVALGPPTVDRDILLSWLMRGGTVAVANTEISGIYNPFADSWLVLRWSQVGGVPRLEQAVLVNGELLRGGAEAPLDAAGTVFAQALVARRLQSLAAFPLLGEHVGAADFFAFYPTVRIVQTERVMAAARAQVGALAQWSRDNPQSLAALDHAIRRADDPAFLSLPERVREALGPVALVATPGGTEVVLQSPVYPARSLFASFATNTAAPEFFTLDLDPVLVGSAAR